MVIAKYLQIAQDLTDKIKHGQYPAGDFLPSEPALAQLYSSSRETIRKALNELIDACLIQKIKGKGSMVLDINRFVFPVSDITTFSELNLSQKMNATTQVLALENRNLPQAIAHQLALTDTAAIFVRRLRTVDSEPIVIDEDYVLKKYVPAITKEQAQTSLYSYFEKELNLEIAYATKTITVEPVDELIAEKLHLQQPNLAVFVRSLTYLKDTSFFQYTVSMHQPDKFKFVDFARRKSAHGGLVL